MLSREDYQSFRGFRLDYDNSQNDNSIYIENDNVEAFNSIDYNHQHFQDESLSQPKSDNYISIDSVYGNEQPFQNFIFSQLEKDNSKSIDSCNCKNQSSQEENLPSPKTNNSLIFRIEKNVDRGFSESNDDSGDSNSNRINILNGERRNQKRGRQNGKKNSQHDKYKNDCRMAKIQRHYFTFVIRLLNLIILTLRKDDYYLFCDIGGNYKSNINQGNRAKLNDKTLKEIFLEAPISGKFSKKDENHNKVVYNRLEKEGQNIILNILDQKFLYLFENVYYKNLKKYDLCSFDVNLGIQSQNSFLEIDLTKDSKIKTFNDLFKKEESMNIKYKKQMYKCAKQYFLFNSLKEE